MAANGVSVVVPTRDRPASLARCLAALRRQACDPPLELVIVDDGSHERERVAAAAAGTIYVRLEGGGPAAARNAGVAAATGAVVCFTDDDCEPAPGWARELTAAIELGAEAAAGPTVTGGAAGAYAQATQLVADHLVERSRTAPGQVAFAPTSNLACRAEVLRGIPFDERYAGYGEDRDWCVRLLAAGHRIAWAPEAVVVHHQRLDLEGFVSKHARYGMGAHRFRNSHPGFRHLEPPEFYLGLLHGAVRRGPATAAAVCLAQAATAAGFLREALARRRDGSASRRA